VPTDHPGRNLILLVTASDRQGQPLPLQSGPMVPAWGGEEAGSPGRGYAKVLQDAASGRSPVVSYWKQAFIVSDNRIPALATDVSSYAFVLSPARGDVHVTAELRFRRLFRPLAAARGWNDPDVVMATEMVSLMTGPSFTLHLPFVFR